MLEFSARDWFSEIWRRCGLRGIIVGLEMKLMIFMSPIDL